MVMINLQNSKKLHELGVESKTWDYYIFPSGEVEPRLKADHVYMVRKGVDYVCPCFDLDSILTKEALIKVFGEELHYLDIMRDMDVYVENLIVEEMGDEYKGVITERTEWQYHRNKLTEIYSEQGYEGVNKYLESYLSGEVSK